MADRPAFRGGRNLALKVPPHQFETTVAFYRDVLGLERIATEGASAAFRFGDLWLWIDRCPQFSQAELWLEVQADDLGAAAEHLARQGVVRCAEIEPLPEDFQGFWIASPAGIVHLVAAPREDPGL
jgi:catechol 2,3-dioxygenase-like lactoylglutathione lyase family enzyme